MIEQLPAKIKPRAERTTPARMLHERRRERIGAMPGRGGIGHAVGIGRRSPHGPQG
jgi:hypothetical protein